MVRPLVKISYYIGTIWSQYKGDDYFQDQNCTCSDGTIETSDSERISAIGLLLTLSGDIELNQGPVRFPCGICG